MVEKFFYLVYTIFMKMWLKVYSNDKMKKNTVFETDDDISVSDFLLAFSTAADAVDSPTPIILDSHVKKLNNFGIVRFYPDDFVEFVPFDKLELEIMRS